MQGAAHRIVLFILLLSGLLATGCVFDGAGLDALTCETDAACEVLGEGAACVGGVCQAARCTSDASCDNGVFCDGDERCAPASPDADLRGCVTGARELDDGVACTEDICDEARAEVRHVRTSACACEADADCAAQATSSCRVGSCEDGECVFSNRQAGAACVPEGACVVDAACDLSGRCVGSLDDRRCDNGAFCDGQETCDPGAAGADPQTGCVAGPAPEPPPELEDDEPCTVVTCDDEGERFYLDASRCGCDEAGAPCDDPDPTDCVAFRCTEELTCQRVNLDAGVGCDDGAACTANDRCNGSGTCEGTPNPAICDDGAFCNGVERCDPGAQEAAASGCAPGVDAVAAWRAAHPDTPACVEVSCDEDADAVNAAPGAACECQTDAECATPCAASARCTEAGRCEVTPRADGDACVRSCASNPSDINGMCQSGACVVPAEGPALQPACSDGFDNDCDGLIDASDDECGLPNRLEAAAPATGAVGRGPGSGVEVTLRALGVQGRPLGGQLDNLYCIAQPLQADLAPESGQVLDAASSAGITVIVDGDAGAVRPGAAWDDGAPGSPLGLRLCAGASITLRDIPQPPATTAGFDDAHQVEITLGNPPQGGLGAGSFLVVSRSEQASGTSGFIPLGLIDSASTGLQQRAFILPRRTRSHLRLEVVTPGGAGGGCAFIQGLRLLVTRRVNTSVGANYQTSTWTLNAASVASVESFNSRDAATFFSAFFELDPSAGHQSDISSASPKVALWRPHAPASVATPRAAWINLPPPGAPPADLAARRWRPLLLDLYAEMGDATAAAQGDRAFIEVNPRGRAWTQLTGLPGSGLGPAYVGGLQRVVLPLPEAAKTHAALRLRASTPGLAAQGARLGLDSLYLYASRLEGCPLDSADDTCLTAYAVLGEEGGAHRVRLHTALAMPHAIRCYWQVPGRPDLDTLASEPLSVSFQ